MDFHERGGDGRYRGRDGEACRSLLGEEAGELITLCVFVCYNIHVTGPPSRSLSNYLLLSNKTLLFYCRILLYFSFRVSPEQLWSEQMFYWKYSECSINAIEASQRAVTTVEMGVRALNKQADFTFKHIC